LSHPDKNIVRVSEGPETFMLRF
jgi:hypothetical protein